MQTKLEEIGKEVGVDDVPQCGLYDLQLHLCAHTHTPHTHTPTHTHTHTHPHTHTHTHTPHTQLKQSCNDDHGKMQAMLPEMLESHSVTSLVFTPVYNPRYRHVIIM